MTENPYKPLQKRSPLQIISFLSDSPYNNPKKNVEHIKLPSREPFLHNPINRTAFYDMTDYQVYEQIYLYKIYIRMHVDTSW